MACLPCACVPHNNIAAQTRRDESASSSNDDSDSDSSSDSESDSSSDSESDEEDAATLLKKRQAERAAKAAESARAASEWVSVSVILRIALLHRMK